MSFVRQDCDWLLRMEPVVQGSTDDHKRQIDPELEVWVLTHEALHTRVQGV